MILFAAVATGRWSYLPAALATASIPVQHYVAYFPALASVAGAALTLGILPGLRGAGWAFKRPIRATLGACSAFPCYCSCRYGPCRFSGSSLAPRNTSSNSRGSSPVMVRATAGQNRENSWSAKSPPCRPPAFSAAAPDRVGHPCALLYALAGIQLLLMVVTYWRAELRHRDSNSLLCLLSAVMLAACGFSIRHAVGPVSHHKILLDECLQSAGSCCGRRNPAFLARPATGDQIPSRPRPSCPRCRHRNPGLRFGFELQRCMLATCTALGRGI